MDDAEIKYLADRLYQAERTRVAVPPLTDGVPDISVSDAYAIQLENVRRVQAEGQKISGKKIGLTSPGIQKQLGVNQPDYGHLFAAMDCTGRPVPMAGLLQPKIEGELAFVLKEDLTGEAVTAEDVLRATDYVVAAFEIVDSRVADWRIKLADTVADNASSGRYILGTKRLPVDAVDLAAVRMELYKNDELVQTGSGDAVMGNPCRAVAWLASCMWGYGVSLKAGEVILSGAFSAAPVAAAGDRFTARFTHFGTVEAVFA